MTSPGPGRAVRVRKELDSLARDPPSGVALLENDEGGDLIRVKLTGPSGTPYSDGSFIVEVTLGHRYPFEPPHVRFITKIFHPNVDESGRICLDTLKLPPAGSWRPSLNLAQILTQLLILFSEPGLSDPLMKEVAELYKNDRKLFDSTARVWTDTHAVNSQAKRGRFSVE